MNEKGLRIYTSNSACSTKQLVMRHEYINEGNKQTTPFGERPDDDNGPLRAPKFLKRMNIFINLEVGKQVIFSRLSARFQRLYEDTLQRTCPS